MEKKINILFLLSRITERGGIARVTSIITDQLLNEKDFNIHIASYQKKEDNGYKWNQNIHFHHLLDSRIKMKYGIIKANKKLRNIIHTNNINIVVSCGQEVGPLGVLATRLNHVKLVYWSHSSFKGKTHSKFKVFNEYFTSLFTNVIVSLTKTDELNYKNKTFAKKVTQIYNPIDISLMSKNRTYKPNTNKIISVGRLSSQKNFLTLVDVAKKVLSKNNNLYWHIYGSGYQEEEILKKIKTNNLEGRLVLMGQTNHLYDLYNDYSLMVMTSNFEGFPMSLIEGLACNLPLISFDIPTGPNEIITDSQNGYLIPHNDIDAMSIKINIMLKDIDKRISFSNEAKNKINNFSIQTIIQQWVSLFNSLN
ncbi:glycosyltransferase involved in cell wall biosynthesis [Maribacter vaceletii]|uniref:Glycosyltransferase involved in cell wall biosynthesis n=1 Tax=Maribacter vaceletii TaxID=1206816 RepID=A0A495DSZ9_9FLAO|nr:glycosyltransferase [Maribacter vaceletii]RKR07184.1 glycosyltransferase involved in cell wall biosynthesis [Maribacter vaceletii]